MCAWLNNYSSNTVTIKLMNALKILKFHMDVSNILVLDCYRKVEQRPHNNVNIITIIIAIYVTEHKNIKLTRMCTNIYIYIPISVILLTLPSV